MASNQVLSPRLFIDIDLNDQPPGAGEWNGFNWDEGSWAEPLYAADEVTDRLLSFQCFRGRRHYMDPMQVGTLSFELDNTDGALDLFAIPTKNPVRLYAVEQNAQQLEPVYTGRLARLLLNRDPQTGFASFQAACQDDLQALQGDLPAIGQTVGGTSDTAPERVTACLGAATAPYNSIPRNILDGVSGGITNSITYSREDTDPPVNLLAQINNAAAFEAGSFFVARDGTFTYLCADYYANQAPYNPYQTPIVTIVEGSKFSWQRFPTLLANDRMLNDIRLNDGKNNNAWREAQDFQSIATYGRRSYQINRSLHNNTTSTQNSCDLLIGLYALPGAQLEGMEVHAASGDWALVIGRLDIGQVCRFTLPDGSQEEIGFIEGLEHRWDIANGWRTVLYISDAWPTSVGAQAE